MSAVRVNTIPLFGSRRLVRDGNTQRWIFTSASAQPVHLTKLESMFINAALCAVSSHADTARLDHLIAMDHSIIHVASCEEVAEPGAMGSIHFVYDVSMGYTQPDAVRTAIDHSITALARRTPEQRSSSVCRNQNCNHGRDCPERREQKISPPPTTT
jgi:hypothetical protein